MRDKQQGADTVGMSLWYFDDEFDTPMPVELAEECARFYGRSQVGVDFAQALAAFLAVDRCRAVLTEALSQYDGYPTNKEKP